jgi:hypothetical protein
MPCGRSSGLPKSRKELQVFVGKVSMKSLILTIFRWWYGSGHSKDWEIGQEKRYREVIRYKDE